MVWANALVWFAGGVLVGLANTWLLLRMVAQLRPGSHSGVRMTVVGGYMLRLSLVVLVLLTAVREGAGTALAAGAGLWLTRWVAVYLGKSGKIDWSRVG